MTIGERIAARRIELGMSQEELAKKLGYKSRSSVNKIEMGDNQLPQKKIVALAYALDTTPDYIMGWQKIESMEYGLRCEFRHKEDCEIANDILNTINQLTREEAQAVLDFAKFQLAQDKYKKATMEGGEVG